jgi:glycosyltransferase involved in cell wall biosynthesis
VVDVLKIIPCEYEILAFDDGSRDRTPLILGELSRQIKALRVFSQPRNLGQGACLWQGLSEARGEVIVTMDGDGQNDPRDIQKMLPLLSQYDAVLGQRVKRQDALTKRVATLIGYFFRHIILGDTVKDTTCSLKVMKREVIRYFIPFQNFFLFIPFMLRQTGVPFASLAVNHRPRTKGRSKYSLATFYFIPYIADLFFMRSCKKFNLYKFRPPQQ